MGSPSNGRRGIRSGWAFFPVVAFWVLASCGAENRPGTADAVDFGATDSVAETPGDLEDVVGDSEHGQADADLLDTVEPLDVEEAVDPIDVSTEAWSPDDETVLGDADRAEEEPFDPWSDQDKDGLPDWRERELGTDPESPDTDRDGVPDGREVEEGTDPTNPASASAWQPEWRLRPRLFFGPEDIGVLRERLETPAGGLAELARRLEKSAAHPVQPHPDGLYDSRFTQSQGWQAGDTALWALLKDDGEALDRVLQMIEAPLPDPFEGVVEGCKYNLEESEALVHLCTAFDLVAASPLVDSERLDRAREALVRRIDTFREMCVDGPSTMMLLTSRNNHLMKYFAAMGLCALAINDRPEAARDISEAVTGMDWMIDQMSTPQGGWGEGWNYLVYGGQTWMAFLAAWHRFAQGRAFPMYGVPDLQPEDTPHHRKVSWIGDFGQSHRLREVMDLAVFVLQPDLRLPPVDDGNPVFFLGPLATLLLDDRDYLVSWARPETGYPVIGPFAATLAAWDGTIAPAYQEQDRFPRQGVFADAGIGLMRTWWTDPDSGVSETEYLLLLGEHGNARSGDPGHEHADELSFLLWAAGRPLVLDPGYIYYGEHDRVKYAKDHNTILVDGKGSPFVELAGTTLRVGSDAFLDPAIGQYGSCSVLTVRTSYENVDFLRRLVRVDRGVFLVVDEMRGAEEALDAHAYTWQLNGNGGGTVPNSEFRMEPLGAYWRNGPAALRVAVAATSGETVFDHRREESVAEWGEFRWHEMLTATASMAWSPGFLSVVLVGRAASGLPEVRLLAQGEGEVGLAFERDGRTVEAWYNSRRDRRADLAPAGLTVRARGPDGVSDICTLDDR